MKKIGKKYSTIIIKEGEIKDIVDFSNKSSFVYIKTKKNSFVRYFFIIISDKDINKEVKIDVLDNSKAEIIGIVISFVDANVNVKTEIVHKGCFGKGEVYVKSVLKDKSLFYYDGVIKILRNINQVSSYLYSKSISLDRSAVCKASPKLEIESGDVVASHSFSQGKIDEEQLFYMQSKGISRVESEKLILRGFLFDLVSRFPESKKQEALDILNNALLSIYK